MTVRRCLLVLAILGVSPVAARADVITPGLHWPWEKRPPRPNPIQLRFEEARRPRVELRIEPTISPETRLQIPRKALAQWQASAFPVVEPTDHPHITPALPTIVAGLALAAALALVGVALARRGPRPKLIAGLACALGSMVLIGVSGCPWYVDRSTLPQRTSPSPVKPLQEQPDGRLTGEVLLESEEKGDTVRLLINQETLSGLAAQP
jgi:hypothetical protein